MRSRRILAACIIFSTTFIIAAAGAVTAGVSVADASACTAIACCALDVDALTGCARVSSKCPGYSGLGALGADGECGTCPVGECRVGNSCVCPSDFLASTEKNGFQQLCEHHYGVIWPKSISKSDKVCGTAPSTWSSTASSSANVTPLPSVSPQPVGGAIVVGPGGIVKYIRDNTTHGTNIIGMVASFVLALLIMAACCCACKRSRR